VCVSVFAGTCLLIRSGGCSEARVCVSVCVSVCAGTCWLIRPGGCSEARVCVCVRCSGF